MSKTPIIWFKPIGPIQGAWAWGFHIGIWRLCGFKMLAVDAAGVLRLEVGVHVLRLEVAWSISLYETEE